MCASLGGEHTKAPKGSSANLSRPIKGRGSALGSLAFARVRYPQASDHLAELLAGGDVAETHFAELLQVEERQSLGKQLAIDHAFAEARNDAKANTAGELVQSCTDTAQVVRFDVLKPVPEHHPIDALAGLLGPRGAAVPDHLGVKARARNLVIFRVHLTDEVQVDKAVVHRRDERVGLENGGAR